MEIYLVGGAVRDRLLNIPSKDKDFLVVGSSPEKMIDLGFKPMVKISLSFSIQKQRKNMP